MDRILYSVPEGGGLEPLPTYHLLILVHIAAVSPAEHPSSREDPDPALLSQKRKDPILVILLHVGNHRLQHLVLVTGIPPFLKLIEVHIVPYLIPVPVIAEILDDIIHEAPCLLPEPLTLQGIEQGSSLSLNIVYIHDNYLINPFPL